MVKISIISQLVYLLLLAGAEVSLSQLQSSVDATRSTANLLRSRGYQAIEHELTTTGGYILKLVQAINPLIGTQTNKTPILCVHGILTRANFFLVNPGEQNLAKDYSRLDAARMSRKQLGQLLADDPAANSIVYLALNFGYQLWLLNKRGTKESRGHISQLVKTASSLPPVAQEEVIVPHSTHNPLVHLFEQISNDIVEKITLGAAANYWNFSMDEQANSDLTESVAYVLEQSGRDKLTLLGHSTGAALALMALADEPQFADRLDKVVLWAPTIDMGGTGRNFIMQIFRRLQTAFELFLGPFPSGSLVPLAKEFFATHCNLAPLRNTSCHLFIERFFGPPGDVENLTFGLVDVFPEAMSSHEMAQIGQALMNGRMRKYDYGMRGNLEKYGQSMAPVYDVASIRNDKISIWYGASDTLAPKETIEKLAQDFTVTVQMELIKDSAECFNHIHFGFHSDVARLLNIPTLQTMESE